MKTLRSRLQTFLFFFATLILLQENRVLGDLTVTIYVQEVADGDGLTVEPGPYGSFHEADTNTTGSVFEISRYGLPDIDLTNSALTVYLIRGGSATGPRNVEETNSCSDYFQDYTIGNLHRFGTVQVPSAGTIEPITNYVVIPAGTNSVEIPVRALLDYECETETNETVTLSIIPDPSYNIQNTNYTIQIENTETAFSFAGPVTNARVYQGNNLTFAVGRSCGSVEPKPLFHTGITNSFILYGAELGVDYTFNSNFTHYAAYGDTNIAVLHTEIPMSNDFFTVTFTALTNNLFGGTKTLYIVASEFYETCYEPYHRSSITILPAGMPILHSETFTNAGFRFSILGANNSLCYISASTNLVNWTNIGSVTLTNSTNSFIDTQASNFLNRFYRAYYTP